MDTTPNRTVEFWRQAFAGATPPSALALALQAGLIPQPALHAHGKAWFQAWLSGWQERFLADYQLPCLRHRAWRQAGGAGNEKNHQLRPHDLPPRLSELTSDHPDAALLGVFEGLALHGVDPFGALPADHPLGTDGVMAAVAMNLPCAIDLLAGRPDKPSAGDLDARLTPGPVLGERIALPWLHAAALGWQDTLLAALLDYGLDPNGRDAKGQTALFHARTPTAVAHLLAAGADPLGQDKHGRTAVEHWAQIKVGFPWGVSATTLTKALGEAGQTPAAQAAAAVLYVAKPPVHDDNMATWEERIPALPGPLYAARLNPGGAWRGEWSPAAWTGMQVLQDGGYYSNHLPILLRRADFLDPSNPAAHPKLSEQGLIGLALALILGQKPNVNPTQGRSPGHGEREQLSRWELEQWTIAAGDRLWFWTGPWAEPIHQTTKALFSHKATTSAVRYNSQEAWLLQFVRLVQGPPSMKEQLRTRLGCATDEQALAALLWRARTQAGLRFEGEGAVDWGWNTVFSHLTPAFAGTFGLLYTSDLIAVARRANRGSFCLDDTLEYGGASKACAHAMDQITKAHGDLGRLSDALDAPLEAVLELLATTEHTKTQVSWFRSRQLDKAWASPHAPARSKKPRL